MTSDKLEPALKQIAEQLPEGTTHAEQVLMIKQAIRELVKEWLDEKLLSFSRWSLKKLAVIAVAAAGYWILAHSGWVYRGN